MTEKQPSADAMEAAIAAADRYTTDYRCGTAGLRHDIALALDAFAARSRREAVTQFAAGIMHGDQPHRDWLASAAKAFNEGATLAPEPVARSRWRPIAEAPKDDTHILVYAPEDFNPAGHYFLACWYEGDQWDFSEGICDPTHWQPLPEPPSCP